MAEGLHIDDDWKRQAQEEKRRLAEQSRPAEPPPAASGTSASTGAPQSGASPQDMPEASFASLVQSLMTQSLFYMGEVVARGQRPQVDLDMARHYIDTLGVIEAKTAGNLSDEERHFLDSTLYELRMRFVSIAQQIVNPPDPRGGMG